MRQSKAYKKKEDMELLFELRDGVFVDMQDTFDVTIRGMPFARIQDCAVQDSDIVLS